jgi:hypothetical protein
MAAFKPLVLLQVTGSSALATFGGPRPASLSTKSLTTLTSPSMQQIKNLQAIDLSN